MDEFITNLGVGVFCLVILPSARHLVPNPQKKKKKKKKESNDRQRISAKVPSSVFPGNLRSMAGSEPPLWEVDPLHSKLNVGRGVRM